MFHIHTYTHSIYTHTHIIYTHTIYTHTIKYYLAEQNKVLSFSENSMELKVIMFNKTSQIQEDKYHTLFPISKTKNPSF